jgi:RNA polymerase sigma factor (sigma-70 family)
MNHLTDEELAAKAQAKNKDAEALLVRRYWDLCGIIANSFPIPGVEIDDRQCEGSQGLLKAIRSYEQGMGTKFKTFAKLCIKRRLIEVYRQANQVSAVPRNLLRSLEAVADDGDDISLADILPADDNPEADAINSVQADETRKALLEHQWSAIVDRINGTGDTVAARRLCESVQRFAKDMVQAGKLPLHIYRDLVDLLEERGAQMDLFSLAPARDSDEAKDCARALFKGYALLQWAILMDLADGFDYAEIADRQKVPQETAANIVASVRQQIHSASHQLEAA